MTRRFIIISFLFVAVVAPILASLVHSELNRQNTIKILTPKLITKTQVEKALNDENNSLVEDERLRNIHVTSIDRYQAVWYITSLTYTTVVGSEKQSTIALVGDLRANPDKLTVVLKPGSSFAHINISNGVGVPYGVVDRINKYYDSQSQVGGE